MILNVVLFYSTYFVSNEYERGIYVACLALSIIACYMLRYQKPIEYKNAFISVVNPIVISLVNILLTFRFFVSFPIGQDVLGNSLVLFNLALIVLFFLIPLWRIKKAE